MKGKRRSIAEKVRILRKADGEQTVLQFGGYPNMVVKL